MSRTASTMGRGLAKVLGIKLENTGQNTQDEVTRGESILSVQTSETFFEEGPTSYGWVKEHVPTRDGVARYACSLFPCLNWIGHYNLHWLAGDVIAGVTIGAIVVPQGMAYASLAKLPPQFGLYSSFLGVVTYWIFGTSKDISIGPVAVLSTVVGNVVNDVTAADPEIPGHYVASALSIVAGAIVLGIGLARCGWIVDLISITSLSAFMTGSAITIGVSQLPALLGITGFSNRDSPYKVLVNTIQHLPDARLDAAMGLTALLLLYLIRFTLTMAADKTPHRKRTIFFASTMRSVFVIFLYTMISWLVNMHRRDNPAFKILGKVPKGFQNLGVPVVNGWIISKFSSYLPATVTVMLVEHIAISKAFGRVNNYQIDPSQEMVAIGVTNILGPFLGGYASTGSFSRTAVQSKAGVRTPAAGIVTGIVVLLATYLLTVAFFYIPSSALSAVIIHAVGDLITPPDTVYQFWRVSPIEVFIFFVGVFVSIFANIEDGLYATVCLSAAVLLLRILKARGRFLGKVKVHSVLGDHVIGDDHRQVIGAYGTFEEALENRNAARNIFLPLDHGDGTNPQVEIDNPYPGIFIYRFSEGFNYPNAAHALDYLTDFIHCRTRRTTDEVFERGGDRPWNNPGPRKSAKDRADPDAGRLPTLKAIILDFSSVNNIDITSVQRLIDVRNQLDAYASPEEVDWHFACINNRWTKRGLISGGFGAPRQTNDGFHHRWRSIFSVAEIGGKTSAAAVAEEEANEALGLSRYKDEEVEAQGNWLIASYCEDLEEAVPTGVEKRTRPRRKGAVVHGLDRPLFHVDLTSAVQSAIVNVEARVEARGSGSGSTSP